jgi:lysophospholipase L1-like esterase
MTTTQSTIRADAIWLATFFAVACSVSVHAAPETSSADRPTLYLVGDSTVKNGSGRGDGGLWGWGQVFALHLYSDRIKLDNQAIGGRSSRTFLTEGRWDRVRDQLKPGDFVLIQFGHNDGGELFKGDRPRASIKGNGDETRDGVVEATGKSETVHSYGWYLRRYVADTQAKGATAIVLSPVPRNMWKDGHVNRASRDYGKWAAEAAHALHAPFVDLNEIIARRYEEAGEETVARDFFTAADHTHTTKAGAYVNAACVAAGVREAVPPLASYVIDSSPSNDASPKKSTP